MMRSRCTFVVLVSLFFVAVCGAGGNSVCQYNLFVLGDANAQYSNVQGRVGVGGNATYTGYSFGQILEANPSRFDLVVGGALSFRNGQLERGSVAAKGNVTLQNVTLGTGNVVSGGTVSLTNGQVQGNISQNQSNPLPFSFYAAAGFLSGASTYYASLPANGQMANQMGGLFLTGTDPALNVFSVQGSLLQSVWGVQIDVPPDSIVLINVDGLTASQPNAGYNYTGTDASHVLFNYFQANTLTIGGGQGTVLAPIADISFPYGVVSGTLIGNSFTGNGQLNSAPFADGLPALPAGYKFCSDLPGGVAR